MSLEKTIQGILEEIDFDNDVTNIPNYILSGSGPAWYVNPESMKMEFVSRGIEIIPIDDICEAEDDDKIVVRAPYRFLVVPKSDIIEIGWN